MAVCMNVALSFFAILVGAVKHGVVLFFQERRAFDGHGTAYIIVGGIDLVLAKAKGFQQVPVEIEILFRFEAQALQAFLSQCIYIKYKPDFECGLNGFIEFTDLIGYEAFLAECLVVNERRTGERGRTYGILNDGLSFFIIILQVLSGPVVLID